MNELMALHAFTAGFGDAIHWAGDSSRLDWTADEDICIGSRANTLQILQSFDETASSSEGVIGG